MSTHRHSLGIWTAVAAAVLLAACASNPRKADPPPITASTTINGKPWPAGRTGSLGSLQLERVSEDPTYGRAEENPIQVAGLADSGSHSERVYLSALRGPQGETLEWFRLGSCCPFESDSSPWGSGLLDVYEVTYPGLSEPIHLYLNMYDAGEVWIPVGFTGTASPGPP